MERLSLIKTPSVVTPQRDGELTKRGMVNRVRRLMILALSSVVLTACWSGTSETAPATTSTSQTTPVGPLTDTEKVERFCDLWGGAADLAEAYVPAGEDEGPDPRVIEAFQRADEVAVDGMGDEMAVIVDTYSEAGGADELPDLDQVVDSAVAARRLDRWFIGNCSLSDGTPPLDDAWQPEIDNNPICIAAERYLAAAEIAGEDDRDLPVVIDALGSLVNLLPEAERAAAELLPAVYVDETQSSDVFAGSMLADTCGLPTT